MCSPTSLPYLRNTSRRFMLCEGKGGLCRKAFLQKHLSHTHLSDSNTKQRWFLWEKWVNSRTQWNLSSGSAALSLRNTSSSV